MLSLDPALTLPPFLIAAALLVVTGLAKLRSPRGAAAALASAGLPSRPALVRALGALEVGVGAAALLAPRPLAPAVAALYVGFAAFLGYVAARRIPLADCGCLGERESPPSRFHLGLDLLAAASAVAVVLTPVGATWVFLAEQPWAGVPLLMLVAVGVFAVHVAMAYLPAAMTAYRPPGAAPR